MSPLAGFAAPAGQIEARISIRNPYNERKMLRVQAARKSFGDGVTKRLGTVAVAGRAHSPSDFTKAKERVWTRIFSVVSDSHMRLLSHSTQPHCERVVPMAELCFPAPKRGCGVHIYTHVGI